MAYAIKNLKSDITPMGPAVIGVSEIENRSVLEDLVKDPQIKEYNYQIVHHDSPDRRGVDVGMLYNPRMFQVLNVTHHFLKVEGEPHFLTRDQTCVTGLLMGEKVSIIVNHWPSRSGGEKGSRHLREAAAALSKIVTGVQTCALPICCRPEAGCDCDGRLERRPVQYQLCGSAWCSPQGERRKGKRFLQSLVGCARQGYRFAGLSRTMEPV